jgi:hypothetical protein
MRYKVYPSQETLLKFFTHDRATGKLFHNRRERDEFNSNRAYNSWNTSWADKETGATPNDEGYLVVTSHGFGELKVHRVVWIMAYGSLPKEDIDHIDGNPQNNRLENLRAASRSDNSCNSGLPINNTSGAKNVWWCNTWKRWFAQVKHKGIVKKSGHATFEAAVEAARQLREEMHGEFVNHGGSPGYKRKKQEETR